MNRMQFGVVAAAGVLVLALGAGAATIGASTGASSDGSTGAGEGVGPPALDLNLSDADSVLPVVDGNFRNLANESDDAKVGADASGRDEGGGESGGSSFVPSFSVPIVVLVVVGVGVIAVVAVAVRRSRSGDATAAGSGSSDDDADGSGASADALAAVSASAGTAASRLEGDVDPENVVYETWFEMARSLDVDRPASSTPGEFAAAAVDAGLSPPDVARLTALFRGVRYGDDQPTATRERDARKAFERIERGAERGVEDANDAATSASGEVEGGNASGDVDGGDVDGGDGGGGE